MSGAVHGLISWWAACLTQLVSNVSTPHVQGVMLCHLTIHQILHRKLHSLPLELKRPHGRINQTVKGNVHRIGRANTHCQVIEAFPTLHWLLYHHLSHHQILSCRYSHHQTSVQTLLCDVQGPLVKGRDCHMLSIWKHHVSYSITVVT